MRCIEAARRTAESGRERPLVSGVRLGDTASAPGPGEQLQHVKMPVPKTKKYMTTKSAQRHRQRRAEWLETASLVRMTP